MTTVNATLEADEIVNTPKGPGFFKKIGFGFIAFGRGTSRSLRCTHLRVLGHFAKKHEISHLKMVNPKLYHHLRTQEYISKLTMKMSKYGPGHKKAIPMLLSGMVGQMQLEQSKPNEMDPIDEANLDAVGSELRYQIKRLKTDLSEEKTHLIEEKMGKLATKMEQPNG